MYISPIEKEVLEEQAKAKAAKSTKPTWTDPRPAKKKAAGKAKKK